MAMTMVVAAQIGFHKFFSRRPARRTFSATFREHPTPWSPGHALFLGFDIGAVILTYTVLGSFL